jgi:hypothetical protein
MTSPLACPSARTFSTARGVGMRWILLGAIAALAACTAITRQPQDFGPRAAAGCVAILLAALGAGCAARRALVAWPLLCGLALATTYRLAYDPMLPDALLQRLPPRLAVLEPTVPMFLVLVLVLGWACWPGRRALAKTPAVALAGRALLHTAQLVVLTGVVLYLGLSRVYNLEGGYWFWRLVVSAACYLGLMWVGVEGAAGGLVGWEAVALALLGVAISLARHLAGGGG